MCSVCFIFLIKHCCSLFFSENLPSCRAKSMHDAKYKSQIWLDNGANYKTSIIFNGQKQVCHSHLGRHFLKQCPLLPSTLNTCYTGYGPFHLMYPPPPLWTRSIKFEPLRKKVQSTDTNIPPEIKKFLPLTPQKKRKDQRMPMHTTPQKRLFQPPSEILVHRGCVY